MRIYELVKQQVYNLRFCSRKTGCELDFNGILTNPGLFYAKRLGNCVHIYIQYWTSPGDNNPQSSSYTTTYHPSQKLSKLDEPDTWDTAGEVGTSSWVMYSCGPWHMDEQRQDVQFKPTCADTRCSPKAMDDREVWRESQEYPCW